MSLIRTLLVCFAILVSITSNSAHSAQSYDSCTGFIDTLPATISSPGNWCLRQDLTFAPNTGTAIKITTSNVTINCNDFKISGVGSTAAGIVALDVYSTTVRNCVIRAFFNGIYISGQSGNLVEDNRLNGNSRFGIFVDSFGSTSNSIIRRNNVSATGGGSLNSGSTIGISTGGSVDILNNIVAGVSSNAGITSDVIGINTNSNSNGSIVGNKVRLPVKYGSGTVYGIRNVTSGRISIHDNDISGDGSAGSLGFFCENTSGRVFKNFVGGFATWNSGCSVGNGNEVVP